MGMGGDGAGSHAGASRQSPPVGAAPFAEKRKRGEGSSGPPKDEALEMERITQKVQRLHGPSFEEEGRDRSQYFKINQVLRELHFDRVRRREHNP